MRYNKSAALLIILKKVASSMEKWTCSIACPNNVEFEPTVVKSELIKFLKKMKVVQQRSMGIAMKKIQSVSVIKLSNFKVQVGRLDSIPASILLALLLNQGSYYECPGQNQGLQITQFRQNFRIPANVQYCNECFEHNKRVIREFIYSYPNINAMDNPNPYMEDPPIEQYSDDLELLSSDETDVQSNSDSG